MSNALKKIKKSRGLILSAVGIAGFTWTCIDTAKQAKKLYQEQLDANPDISTKEKLKMGLKYYWRPILEGTISAGVIFGGSALDHREMTALAGAAALGYKKYSDYRKANIEVNGKEADDNVIRKIANDKYPRGRINAKEDETLFYDEFSETFFVSTWEDVKDAEFGLNRNYHIKFENELIEYYDFLGILDEVFKNDRAKLTYYEDLVWDQYLMETCWGLNNIDILYSKDTLDDGQEYVRISFVAPPLSYEERTNEYRSCGIEM